MSEVLQTSSEPAKSERLSLDAETLNALSFGKLAVAAADSLGGYTTQRYGSSRWIKKLLLNEVGQRWRALEISSTKEADRFSNKGSVILTHEVAFSRSLIGAPQDKRQWGMIIPRDDLDNITCFYTEYENFNKGDIPDELFYPQPHDLVLMKAFLIEGLCANGDNEVIQLPSGATIKNILQTLSEPMPSAARTESNYG